MSLSSADATRLIGSMQGIVGEGNVFTRDDALPYLCEPRGQMQGQGLCVVRPGTRDEVVQILQFAYNGRLAIVPQGGNTGLVGGQTFVDARPAIIVSLERMQALRNINTDNNSMVVEAGMTLRAARAIARENNRLFPLKLASQGSCRIGGNIATNAGGSGVLAYGNMRALVLGLEVVLPDGRCLDGLRCILKDNTGYDLNQYFIGSEGTLGIITAACLRLFRAPGAYGTAITGVQSPAHAARLFQRMSGAFANRLTAFELMPRIGVTFVVEHVPGSRDPLRDRHPWYVLCEISAPEGDNESGNDVDNGGEPGAKLDARLQMVLGRALKAGDITDAVVAQSRAQRLAFWALRENLSEVQRYEGASIKHDVSVPVDRMAALIERAEEAILAAEPGARPVIFGHMGDGNVHLNVSQPRGASAAAFLQGRQAINEIVYALVLDMGGSIAAEHGIGRVKAGLLPRVRSETEIALMRAIKRTVDPRGIMNPGCILK